MKALAVRAVLAWQQRAPFLRAVVLGTICTAMVAGIATAVTAGTAAGVVVSFLITAAGYILTWVAVVRCWRITYRPGVVGFVCCAVVQLAGALVLASFPEFVTGHLAGHSLGFRLLLFLFGLMIGPGVYGPISYVFAGSPSARQMRLQPATSAEPRRAERAY